MELAGLSFLDSPGSGSSRFLEPKALRAASLAVPVLRKPLTLNTNLKKKNNHPENKQLVRIAGHPNKLMSQNKFRNL